MNLWWSSLSGGAQFYWAVAIFASALQVMLLITSFCGGHFEFSHGDAGADTSCGHGDPGVRLVSLRVLTAFFVGFGWSGVLGLQRGMSGISTTMSALVTGLIFMFLLFGMLRFLISMGSDGTLNYQHAIGQPGQVYVTIPASRAGPGQIEIMLQGRLITASAMTDAPAPISPRTPIEVTGVNGATLLIVRPAIPS